MKLRSLFLSLLIALSCLCGGTLTGCGSGENSAFQYILPGEPVTLDPQVADDENAKLVITALYEGLTRLGDAGEALPGVAERWEVDASGTVYTFYLRQDAKWSDGSPVTASDFRFAFQRALLPETNSTVCQSMDVIENAQAIRQGTVDPEQLGVTVLDDHTLEIRLCYADPEFPALLAESLFMPCKEEYFLQAEGKYGTDSAYTMGNGPFRMENRYSWEHGEYINLIRSETYVGAESVSPAKLTITIRGDETEGGPLQWLLNGSSDGAQLSLDQREQAAEAGCAVTDFQDTTWGLCFNTKATSVSSANVRRALLQSLDRDKILAQIPDGTAAADSLIPPSVTFCGSSYPAGQSALSLGSRTDAANKEQVPAITVVCPDTDSAKRMVNEMITAWNSAMGHYYNMEPLPEEELLSRVSSGDFEAAVVPVRASSRGPQSLLSLFHSDSKENPAFLSSKTYDQLLQVPENATVQTVLSQYRLAERYLTENGVFYPLYYETTSYGVSPAVSDVTVLPYGGGFDFSRGKKSG